MANEKECSELRPWIKSITNHLYWTAASTPEQDGELMLSKWNSLTNHIINIHEGHSGRFVKCIHGDLSRDREQRKWLKPGTENQKLPCKCKKMYYNIMMPTYISISNKE